MGIVFIDSFVYQGDDGNAPAPERKRHLDKKWDIAGTGLLDPYIKRVRDPGGPVFTDKWTRELRDNLVIGPDEGRRHCVEFGDNQIGSVTKKFAATDDAVIGFSISAFGTDSLPSELFVEFQSPAGGAIATFVIRYGTPSGVRFHTGGFLSSPFYTSAPPWEYVEFRVKQHPSLGVMSIRANDPDDPLTYVAATQTGLSLGGTPIGGIRIGPVFQSPASQHVRDLYIRDVSDIAGGFDEATDFYEYWMIGAKRADAVNSVYLFSDTSKALQPFVGTNNESAAFAFSPDASFDVTYKPMCSIVGNNDNIDEDWSMPTDATASPQIIAVQPSLLMNSSGTEVATYRHTAVIDGTAIDSGVDIRPPQEGMKVSTFVITANPTTSGDLSQDDIDGMVAGLKITSIGG